MADIIKPQKGPQERFLATPADIAIYGGAAGGGKSYALLMTPLRYKGVQDFSCTIFRKNFNQIFSQGGLWHEAEKMYRGIKGAQKKPGDAAWTFQDKSGNVVSRVDFRHIERYDEVHKFQGSQICELCCDVNEEVLLADGSYKKVRDITVGDCVRTLNGDFEVSHVGIEENRECVFAELGNGEGQIQTLDHKILTAKGWMSYNDVTCDAVDEAYRLYLSTVYRFREEHGEPFGLIYDDYLRNLEDRYRGLKRLLASRKEILLGIGICSLFGRILNEFLRLLICEPIQYYADQVCALYSKPHTQDVQRQCDNLLVGLSHTFEGLLKTSEMLLQDLEGSFSNTGQQGLGIDCELFALKYQELLRHVSDRLLQERNALIRQLSLENETNVLMHDESLNVPSEKQLEGCLDYCCVCLGLCDEHIRLFQDIYQGDALRLDDVVIHSPNDSRLCDKGRTQVNNHHGVRYSHPYIESLHFLAEERVSFSTISLTPCGIHKVRNFTVSAMNHYITKSGLVNKNCFDELTHFDRDTFFYMLSRNRSTCGVKPFVRATCNPDANSWVAEFIDWWIDPDTGYPIQERSGKLRFFIRRDDQIYWADTRAELWAQFDLKTDEEKQEPRSVTFIMSSVYDNKALLQANPQYLANLKALATIERERLLMGNWKIKPSAGLYFKREQLGNILSVVPDDVTTWVRCWDLAATEKDDNNDPAYTAGVLMGKRKNGRYIVADVINRQLSASDVRNIIKLTAQTDLARWKRVRIRLPQDPGQAGKDQAQSYIKFLSGFDVTAVLESGSKESRATPMAAQWQAGNFDIVYGDWNDAYLNQLEGFPDAKFKDMVDASANGFAELELRSQFNLSNFF